MASGVKSISDLQKELYPLLSNIHVKDEIKPIGTFNIADTTDENIYKIPEEQLNLDKEKYKQFLQFMIDKLKINNDQYIKNEGEILTAHYVDDKYNLEIDKIIKLYDELYNLNDKTWQTQNKKKNKTKYPNWLELLNITRSVRYNEIEREIKIENILEQSNIDFLKTLEKRKLGLDECIKKKDINPSKKEYYEKEYEIESEHIDGNKNNNDNNNIKTLKKIKKICQNINWGSKSYEYHKNKMFKYDVFNDFITRNPLEIEYLKTFLPDNCFNENNTLNQQQIMLLVDNNDKIHKQYIFGFGNELLKQFSNYKQFYEIFNIEPSGGNPCHKLVNWNIILNMVYNRCAISNDDIDFPARFILPIEERHITKKPENEYNDYNIKNIAPTLDIFNSNKNLIFIGFLNIKFFYEETQQFRNWILFIFYDDNDKEKFIIYNYKFIRVNMGDLLGRISITYRELKDFTIKSKKISYFFIYLIKIII